MIAIATVTVVLGDREYIIREAPRLRSAPWRKRLMVELKPMFDHVAGAQEMTFESPADLLRLWPVMETLMVSGLDSVFEMLMAYDPELEADREYIEQTATDKQILAAFGEVARLADPFGIVASLNAQIGRSAIGTSQKSPLPNGT
jgi:hypothetical protein